MRMRPWQGAGRDFKELDFLKPPAVSLGRISYSRGALPLLYAGAVFGGFCPQGKNRRKPRPHIVKGAPPWL